MVLCEGLLVSLVKMIDRISRPPPLAKRAGGRPVTYPDRLLLKVLVIRIIRRLYTAWAVLRFLEQPEPLGQQWRDVLSEPGPFPSRRTWERRLERLPMTLPGLIGGLGRLRVQVLNPWAEQGHGAALDSTPLRAHGGVWHKQDREQGVVPHPRIDTEAAGSKSGYHGWWYGWWYGWQLHLAVTIGRRWIPRAAEFTPAHEADHVIAPRLLRELPLAVRDVSGDQQYNTPQRQAEWALPHRERVATRRGAYPPLPRAGWKSGVFSTRCAPRPSSRSRACSNGSLSGTATCPSKA